MKASEAISKMTLYIAEYVSTGFQNLDDLLGGGIPIGRSVLFLGDNTPQFRLLCEEMASRCLDSFFGKVLYWDNQGEPAKWSRCKDDVGLLSSNMDQVKLLEKLAGMMELVKGAGEKCVVFVDRLHPANEPDGGELYDATANISEICRTRQCGLVVIGHKDDDLDTVECDVDIVVRVSIKPHEADPLAMEVHWELTKHRYGPRGRSIDVCAASVFKDDTPTN